ncbi:helix-turn-helix domain-containing protein [Streptomyces phaeochromogenes]
MVKTPMERRGGEPGAHWHDALWRTCPPAAQAFDGRVRSRCVGDIRISTSALGAWDVSWSQQHIAQPMDRFMLMWVQHAGTTEVQQGGNRAVLAAGDLTVINVSEPYRISTSSDSRSRVFRVPRSRFGTSQSSVARLAGVPIFGTTGSARVVSSFLDAVADETAGSGTDVSPAIVGQGISLISALAEELTFAANAPAAEGRDLMARIVSYLDERLGDPELTVASAARAHSMSVRSLQRLFAITGRTVSETVRDRRLEAIRHELEQPRSRTRTIAAIARDLGYTDAPHFSRSFRRAYGVSPREWQQRSAAADGSNGRPLRA